MAIILHIDTATEHGAVGLSDGEKILSSRVTASQREHASFLQPAIADICKETGVLLKNIDAVSVSIGPGSYTGLRVGLASAKGLCYALNKPLITIGTLEVMARAAIKSEAMSNIPVYEDTLYCPMIDARRMEVFTAIYNHELKQLEPPQALIIDENIFKSYLITNTIIFSGNGALKLIDMVEKSNVRILHIEHSIADLAALAYKQFENQVFADAAYCEPFYLKPFYTTSIQKKKY